MTKRGLRRIAQRVRSGSLRSRLRRDAWDRRWRKVRRPRMRPVPPLRTSHVFGPATGQHLCRRGESRRDRGTPPKDQPLEDPCRENLGREAAARRGDTQGGMRSGRKSPGSVLNTAERVPLEISSSTNRAPSRTLFGAWVGVRKNNCFQPTNPGEARKFASEDIGRQGIVSTTPGSRLRALSSCAVPGAGSGGSRPHSTNTQKR